ncbi:MAG: hypothetical protein E7L17_14695 [Clostridium sp.]|uniref:hypothetical protein n=1 Tax=Clostridium sp. TaxID=1506 RepID=UPI0029065894|nr:hypothetical protein [Clostridium sp.]MDU7339349.1 hypothetical protein [Clostridium sp.]
MTRGKSFRILSILGGEDTPLKTNEAFEIEGYDGEFRISKDGYFQVRPIYCSFWVNGRGDIFMNIIDNPERIIRSKPRLTFTDDEKALMRLYAGTGYPWIARDDNNELYVYESKPKKHTGIFVRYASENDLVEIFDSFLPQITWENSPIYIPDYVEVAK